MFPPRLRTEFLGSSRPAQPRLHLSHIFCRPEVAMKRVIIVPVTETRQSPGMEILAPGGSIAALVGDTFEERTRSAYDSEDSFFLFGRRRSSRSLHLQHLGGSRSFCKGQDWGHHTKRQKSYAKRWDVRIAATCPICRLAVQVRTTAAVVGDGAAEVQPGPKPQPAKATRPR
jgi:hypothetical protein